MQEGHSCRPEEGEHGGGIAVGAGGRRRSDGWLA